MNKKVIFCTVTGLFWFSMYTYAPYLTNYAKEMGASYQMIGLITGAYGMSQTLLRIPLGFLSDRLKKRKGFITLGLLIIALSTLLVFLFPQINTLLAARLFAGVAAATWVNYTVMFSNYYPSSQTAEAMGIINSTNKAGQFIAVLAAGFVVTTLGIPYLFLISAFGGVVGFTLSLFIYEEEEILEEQSSRVSIAGAVHAFYDKQLLVVSILSAFSQVITYSTAFGFTPLIASDLGATPMQLSLLAVAYNFPQIVFAALTGILFLRYLSKKNTLILGFTASGLLCMLTPFVRSLGALYAVQILGGIANAITFPLLMGLAIEHVTPALKTSVMGFFQAMYGVGMIVGPILTGSIGERFGIQWGFIAIGGFGLAATLLIQIAGVEKERAACKDLANQ